MSAPFEHSESLRTARGHANAGRFSDCLELCRQIRKGSPDDVDAQLDVGGLLADYGLLSEALACYQRAQSLAPADLRTCVNLANLARDAGEHAPARQLYAQLQEVLPDHPVVRRNALTTLEYAPEVADAERLAQAKAWGAWAIARAGGLRRRPELATLDGRSLRLAYVSADLCQHTVGLFVKEVLKAHDPGRVQVFAYSAGRVKTG